MESDEQKKNLERLLDEYACKVLGEPVPDSECVRHHDVTVTTPDNVKAEGVKPKKEPEVVVFHSRKRKNISKPSAKMMPAAEALEKAINDTPTLKNSKYTNDQLNSAVVLKKLKFDVGSFGMKAFSKEEQREQERQRAVRLGAKPPKKTSVNYKVFMEERKRKMEQTESNGERCIGTKRKNAKARGPAQFWKEGNKSYTPQVGKYRNGILKLSSKDIKSVKKHK